MLARPLFFSTFITLSALSAIAALVFSIDYYTDHNESISATQALHSKQTAAATNKFEQLLASVQKEARVIVSDFEQGHYDEPNTLNDRLKKIELLNPHIYEVGVAFEPNAYDKLVRLHAPFYSRQDGKLVLQHIQNTQDYTGDQAHWYHAGLKSAGWIAPSEAKSGNTLVAEYVMPFSLPDADGRLQSEKISGVVFINIDLAQLNTLIHRMGLGEHGYGFIATQPGVIIAHPVKEYVDNRITLFDLAENRDDQQYADLSELFNQGNAGSTEYSSEVTGRDSRIRLQPLLETGWSLATVISKPALALIDTRLLRSLYQVWTSLILCLVFLLLSRFARPQSLSTKSTWLHSVTISILFLLGIGGFWFLTSQGPDERADDTLRIIDRATLDDFKLERIKRALRNHQVPPQYVPTGVFIQSLEFESSHNVIVTGYAWQKYTHGIHDHLSRGLVLPEAENVELIEAYKRKEGNAEVIGWYFQGMLRQDFDYSRFPLDRQDVWLRLWHSDFDKNVILVPDIEAYDLMNPQSLPGVEGDFVLSGWDLDESFFEFRFNDYNTNFGIDDYVGQKNFPELYFNVGLTRNFLDPFISHLTALLIVLLMLFAVLLTTTKEEDRISLLGFNASTVLASCSALFFVVLLSHISVRESLAARELVYLEYFYFITYGVILAVSLNSILFTLKTNIHFIDHRENLLPKLAFWPVILGLMFIATMLEFY